MAAAGTNRDIGGSHSRGRCPALSSDLDKPVAGTRKATPHPKSYRPWALLRRLMGQEYRGRGTREDAHDCGDVFQGLLVLGRRLSRDDDNGPGPWLWVEPEPPSCPHLPVRQHKPDAPSVRLIGVATGLVHVVTDRTARFIKNARWGSHLTCDLDCLGLLGDVDHVAILEREVVPAAGVFFGGFAVLWQGDPLFP